MRLYKTATRDDLLRKLAQRYTKEKNEIVRLRKRIKRLEKVKGAAYEYLQARANVSDTVQAAHARERCFAALRFALLTCKRAEAQDK